MRERVVQAARYGVRVGLFAGILCAILLIIDHETSFLLVGPAAWFVAIFVIVFALAYAFPSASGRLAFPGARKIVWPIVALLTVATAVIIAVDKVNGDL